MNKLKIFLITSLFIINAYGKIGCIDNSYHGATCMGYDYKNYHYVSCSCPCDRYAHLLDRNSCTRCGHFHKIRKNKIVRYI